MTEQEMPAELFDYLISKCTFANCKLFGKIDEWTPMLVPWPWPSLFE